VTSRGWFAAILVVSACATHAEAQLPGAADSAGSGPRAVISGIVFDSVARHPLVGAIVQLVRRDALASATRNAVTDSTGAYSIAGVERGVYLIGFDHRVLDALRLEAPVRIIQIESTPAVVNLAIPGPAGVKAALCPRGPSPDSTGLVLGIVRDADTDLPLPGSTVVLVWSELVIGGGRIARERRQVPAKTDAFGSYAICNVPSDADPIARAEHGVASTGFVQVSVPAGGLVVQNFGIATDTATSNAAGRGSARVAGTVRAGGKMLAGARVVLWGSDIEDETDSEGRFELTELPAGTRSIEVLYVGYLPKRLAVDLASGRETSVDVVLDDRTPVLEAVTVLGKRNRRPALTGFLQRRQQGFGHFMTRQDIEKRNVMHVTDLLRTVPGVRVTPARGIAYVVTLRGGCRPTIVVDGMRLFTGFSDDDALDDLDMIVRPEQILGIEVYNGPAGAPMEYGVGGCGSILIWTGPNLR
jgi:hypothetical protein